MQYTTQYHIQDYTAFHYEIVPSTADMAKQDMFQHYDKYIIIADTQQSGRGRLGNIWHGNTGNLLCNVVTHIHQPIHRWSEVSLVIGLAVSDVISKVIPDTHQVQLKWPNDILVDGAKIAGILLETIHMHTHTPKLSIGIGLNIATSPIIESYQTCYLSRFGVHVTASDILPIIVQRFEQWLATWQTQGLQTIVSLWMARAWGVGNNIRVRTSQQQVHGVFVGLSETGALLLRTENGHITINAGEVVFG